VSSSTRPGAAVPLFHAKVGAVQGISSHNYIVAPDGQRFLLDTVVEEIPAPISVIVNERRGEAASAVDSNTNLSSRR
jgi:hypothetical protein